MRLDGKVALLGGTFTADARLRRYCTRVSAQTGSDVETARRLGLDRRTVRMKVDGGSAGPSGAGPAGAEA